ncbi:MAG: YkvA family protein [Ginsengibacter sp.]
MNLKLLGNLKRKAIKLKAEGQVLIIALKDKRTPFYAKILIGITVGYLLSPVDLIPDFIPVLGLVDDLLIVPALIALSTRLIPKVVLEEAREEVKNKRSRTKKKKWLFGIFVIIIWICVLYLVFLLVRSWFARKR